jgi:thiol-disulfide isomerase/thioredoxin
MRKINIILLTVLAVTYQGVAQNWPPEPWGPQPEVGKLLPDYTLDNVTHYKRIRASLSDFKGKWLFLDFWGLSCSATIRSFPKVNALQIEFKDKLNWVMVGDNDKRSNKGIQVLYERLARKQSLEMVSAYDSILSYKWGIWTIPTIIIADPDGVIRAMTHEVNADQIRNLLNGKEVSFSPLSKDLPEFDINKSISSEHLLYRSVLTQWNGERQRTGFPFDDYVQYYDKYKQEDREKGWQVIKAPLSVLYNYAYLGKRSFEKSDTLYGKYWLNPILETRDTVLFQSNWSTGKGLYNYNLTVPRSKINKGYLMRSVQQELKNIFGFEVSIETRPIPAWKLIVTKPGVAEKLKTKGGEKFFSEGVTTAGYSFKNYSSSYLLVMLQASFLEVHYFPFVDETGITGNIDFSIDADMTNLEDVRKALQKQGLDFVRGTHEMKVLVIRDQKN